MKAPNQMNGNGICYHATVKELAEFLRKSPRTIHRWIEKRQMDSFGGGRGSEVLIPESGIESAYVRRYRRIKRPVPGRPGESRLPTEAELRAECRAAWRAFKDRLQPDSNGAEASRLADLERRVAHLEKAIEMGIIELITGKAA